MKMNGIKAIGFATLLGAGAVLTGCNQCHLDENIDYVKNTGISVKDFEKLNKDYYNDNTNIGCCEFWQKTRDSLYWTKKLDSVKTAVVDSFKSIKK